jgi:Na+-translocating ferredoxin:NAD+ oxidoreductase RnfD subunit
MIGYVVLLISFPVQMTSWLPPRDRWPPLRPAFLTAC